MDQLSIKSWKVESSLCYTDREDSPEQYCVIMPSSLIVDDNKVNKGQTHLRSNVVYFRLPEWVIAFFSENRGKFTFCSSTFCNKNPSLVTEVHVEVTHTFGCYSRLKPCQNTWAVIYSINKS